jgi:hypothetical protein
VPLPGLLSDLDSTQAISSWSFQHARDHDEIDAALFLKGINSPPTPLDPMPPLEQTGAWLLRHQQKHTDMNAALQLSGSDLTKFDLSNHDQLLAFAGENFSEHTDIHDALKI